MDTAKQRTKQHGSGLAALAAVWLGLALLSSSASADTPPNARVARLTFTEGYVRIDHSDHTAGDPAQLNMPLVEGQTVITGENGQAEIEFEDGSSARVTPNSTLSLSHLTVDSGGNYSTQLGLVKGLAYFELRSVPKFAYTVDAGGDMITPAENAAVRVNLDEAPAAVAVLLGSAHVERVGSYRTDVHAGETFRSDVSGAGRYFLSQEIATDTWDQWNEARDQAAMDVAPSQTTARNGFAGNEGYGWSDLDANGSWYNVPGQGQVWQPTGGDSADFDPYGNGSWVWYPNSGYLWASSYSWGWTPFRCGGWSYWNTFGWGWSPNGGCGLAGYGGYGYGGGGGGYINILLPPRRGYPVHRPPGGNPPGLHPIVRVHTEAPASGVVVHSGVRQIAGVTVTPLKPVGQAYTPRGGSALGASLGRDFPVDRATHTAVLGVAPVHEASSSSFVNAGQSGFRPGLQPGIRPGQPQGMRPSSQSGWHPANNAQGSPSRPAGQSMQQSGARYSAPQQTSRPSYSAPSAPASHSAPSAPSGGSRK